MEVSERFCVFMKKVKKPLVLKTAIKTSLVVGVLLNVSNQGHEIFAGTGTHIDSILLNFIIPFCVSAYSGAKTIDESSP